MSCVGTAGSKREARLPKCSIQTDIDYYSDNSEDEHSSRDSHFSSARNIQNDAICLDEMSPREPRSKKSPLSNGKQRRRSRKNRVTVNSGSAEVMYTKKKHVKSCALESVTEKMINDILTPPQKEKHSRQKRNVSHARRTPENEEPLKVAQQQQQQNGPIRGRSNKKSNFSFGSPARHQRTEKADTGKVGSLGMIRFPIKNPKPRRMVGGMVGGSQQNGLFGDASLTSLKKRNAASEKSISDPFLKNRDGWGNAIPIPERNIRVNAVHDDAESSNDNPKEHEVLEIDDSDESQDNNLSRDADNFFKITHEDNTDQIEKSERNAETFMIDDENSAEGSIEEDQDKTVTALFKRMDPEIESSQDQQSDVEMTNLSEMRRNICATPPSPSAKSCDSGNYFSHETNNDNIHKMLFHEDDEQLSEDLMTQEERTKIGGQTMINENSSGDHKKGTILSPNTPTSPPPTVPRNKNIMHESEYHSAKIRMSHRSTGTSVLILSKANGKKTERRRHKKKKGVPIVPGKTIQSSSFRVEQDDIISCSSSLSAQEFSFEQRQSQSPIHSSSSRVHCDDSQMRPVEISAQGPNKNYCKERLNKMNEECKANSPCREPRSRLKQEDKKQVSCSLGVDPPSFYAKKKGHDSRSTDNTNIEIQARPKKRKRELERHSSKSKRMEVIDIVDLSSSEDEEKCADAVSGTRLPNNAEKVENDTQTPTAAPCTAGDLYELDATRIAFGEKVFSSCCKLSVFLGESNSHLTIEYNTLDSASGTPATKNNSLSDRRPLKSRHTVYINDSITHMVYYSVKDDESDSESETIPLMRMDKPEETSNRSSDGIRESTTKAKKSEYPIQNDQMSFLAMRVTPNDENKLVMFSDTYDHSVVEGDDANKYIVIEVRSNEEFQDVLDKMRSNASIVKYLHKSLEYSETYEYLKALKKDTLKEEQKRLSSLDSSQRKTRSSTRKKSVDASQNRVLLVYPFTSDMNSLEDAALGLMEASGAHPHSHIEVDDQQSVSDSIKKTGSNELAASTVDISKKIRGRNHYLTIRKEDLDRLEPEEFLNDTIIDFWMRWIWRKEIHDSESVVHFFISHFFTALREDGPKAVSSWTAKKNINVFKKRLVFLPINESLHWSLCVIVNPGSINCNGNDLSCILFLDSLKAHRKGRISKYVRDWLNYEWKRLVKCDPLEAPFNNCTMPVYDPKSEYYFPIYFVIECFIHVADDSST